MRQDAIDTLYRALRNDGQFALPAAALLYKTGSSLSEIETAMVAFGDLPTTPVTSRLADTSSHEPGCDLFTWRERCSCSPYKDGGR